jgi:hypothetical protein
MNRAIFIYTIKRYLHWSTLVTGGFLLGSWSLMIAALIVSDFNFTREAARSMLFGPLVPVFIGYGVIMPQVANSQLRKDGEYLSLIFSRPVPRWSYVITKWLSGAFFILAVIAFVGLFAFGLASLFGHHQNSVIDCYAVIDVVANALGIAALVVLISTIPSPWGYVIFAGVSVCCMVLSVGTGTLTYLSSFSLAEMSKAVAISSQLLFSMFAASIDSYHICNSSKFPVVDVIVYVSNILLYLTLSVLIMVNREFFYAND